jgi:hypothetical protein
VKLDPGAHKGNAFSFSLKIGCDRCLHIYSIMHGISSIPWFVVANTSLEVVTLPYMFSSLALLYQSVSPLVDVVAGGCYQVHVQDPCSFSEEDVQNHCRHCWVRLGMATGRVWVG